MNIDNYFGIEKKQVSKMKGTKHSISKESEGEEPQDKTAMKNAAIGAYIQRLEGKHEKAIQSKRSIESTERQDKRRSRGTNR